MPAPTRALSRNLTRPLVVTAGTDPEAGLITPDQIPGLLAWYSAAVFNGIADGAAVSLWADRSGKGNNVSQATAAKQPVYHAAGINGRPSLGGAAGRTMQNTGSNLLGASNSAYTVLACGKAASAAGGAIATLRLTAPFSVAQIYTSAGTTYVHTDGANGSTNCTISDSTFKQSPFISAHVFKGGNTNPDIFANGQLRPITSSSTHQATESGTAGWELFNNATGTPWLGDLAEILIFDHALNLTDRAAVEAYLSQMYGIAVLAA